MKKIISLLAACTLFAVCLPVSAADAVTEDSALLQNSVVEQTDPYTFYFVPERTYVSAEEVTSWRCPHSNQSLHQGQHPTNQANYRCTHSLSERFQQPLFLQQQQHSQHNGYVQAILQWRFFLLRICDADLLRGNYLFRHLHPLQLCTADQCPADRTLQRFFHSERWSWRHLFHSLL